MAIKAKKTAKKKVKPAFNHKTALIAFTKAKRDVLEKAVGPTGRKYAKAGDYAEIKSWSDAEAEYVWKKLAFDIDKGAAGFGCATCPFCIRHEGCDGDCGYGRRHGRCTSIIVNDYSRIMVAVMKRYQVDNGYGAGSILEAKVLTTAVYKRIIRLATKAGTGK